MKNFNFRAVIGSMAIAMLVFWSSCDKYDQAPASYDEKAVSSEAANERILMINGKQIVGLNIVDGVMHFKDVESIRKAYDLISNASESEYNKFLRAANFKSLYSIYNELQRKVEVLADANDAKGVFDIYNKNSDIFEKKEDYYDLKLQATPMAKLIPRERILFVNEVLYFYNENGQVIVESGSVEILKQYLFTKSINITKGIRVSSNLVKVNSNLRAACVVSFNSGWVENSNHDRRAIVGYNTLSYEYYRGSNFYEYVYYSQIDARAQKKNNIIGWNNVSTNHTITINSLIDRFRIAYNSGTINTITTTNIVGNTNNQTTAYIQVYRNTWSLSPFVANYSSEPNILSPQSVNVSYSNQGGVSISLTCN